MGKAIARGLLGLGVLVLFAAWSAKADSTLTFQDGNTLTGNFVYDATTNSIVSYDFTSTEFTGYPGGTSFSSGTGSGSVVLSNQNGDEVIAFDEAQSSTSTVAELDLVLNCGGTANCLTQASNGNSFALTAGIPACTIGGSGFCIASGEQFSVPECLGSLCEELLSAGQFLDITDPPSTDQLYTLTLNTASTGTVFGGNNNGGGTTATPEPSSILLMALGLLGLAYVKFFSGKRANQVSIGPQF